MDSKCLCREHREELAGELRVVAHRLRGPVGVLLSMEAELEKLPKDTAEILNEAIGKLRDLTTACTERYASIMEAASDG